MSWQATAWSLAQTTGSPTRKVILLALANYADDTGCAWPSQTRIAAETETSERTVRRTLIELERRGLITRVRRRDRGRELTSVYRLAMPPAKLAGGEVVKNPAVKMTGGEGPNRRPTAVKAAGHSLAGNKTVNSQHAAAPRKSRRMTATGIVVWTPDDLAEAQRLEASVPADDLRAATAALASESKEPLPGRVAAALQSAEHAAKSKERQRAAESRRKAELSRSQADAASSDHELVRCAEQAFPALARIRSRERSTHAVD